MNSFDPGIDEQVAGGAHGADETRLLRVVAQLAAEGGDVHVDRAIEHLVVPVAAFVEQGFAGLHAPSGAGEAGQKIELHGGERDRRLADHHAARAEIHAERAHDDFLGGGCGRRRRGVTGGTSQDGAEPGEEFAGGERFRQVVVGADLEADDAIRLVAAGREHEHRHRTVLADPPEHLEAVHAWQHDVEDDGMPVCSGLKCPFEAECAIVHRRDLHGEGLKVGGDEAAQLTVVVDHQQPGAAWSAGVHGRGHRAGGGPDRNPYPRGGGGRGPVRAAALRAVRSAADAGRRPLPAPSAVGLISAVGRTLPLFTASVGSRALRWSVWFVLGVLAGAGFVAPVSAADVHLRIEPRWGGEALAWPDTEHATAAGQRVRVTRLSALLGGFQLRRADGAVVRLDGQFGAIDASGGRLDVTLRGVPDGEYDGLRVEFGLPDEINHADVGLWPAGHPLNPTVNGLHWSWQGGYVFFALEGYWRDAETADASGFSYHLARVPQRMGVWLQTAFRIDGPTRVALALDVSSLFRDLTIARATGTDTTHSAPDDPLAGALARRVERGVFWLQALPRASDGGDVASGSNERALAGPPATGAGTPYAFTVPAGFPQPALPADNPLTEEGIRLGRRLFFDRRLSGNGSQSCAGCHDPQAGLGDVVSLSLGAEGEPGRRNAMPLHNLAWHPAFAWDGTRAAIRDQARAAMTNPIEMNARPADVEARLGRDPRVTRDFVAAFGDGRVTLERMGLALEQYLLSLVSAESRFDAALAGRTELTPEERRGFELFMTESDPARGRRGADCFHCHGGALFSDFVARNNGLDVVASDPGARNRSGLPEDQGRFKTPSLRNVALTAPYMHDGRFQTLEQVVAHYDHGVQRAANLDPNLAKHGSTGLGLSDDDQRALVAFLRTLTDEGFAQRAEPEPPPRFALRR